MPMIAVTGAVIVLSTLPAIEGRLELFLGLRRADEDQPHGAHVGRRGAHLGQVVDLPQQLVGHRLIQPGRMACGPDERSNPSEHRPIGKASACPFVEVWLLGCWLHRPSACRASDIVAKSPAEAERSVGKAAARATRRFDWRDTNEGRRVIGQPMPRREFRAEGGQSHLLRGLRKVGTVPVGLGSAFCGGELAMAWDHRRFWFVDLVVLVLIGLFLAALLLPATRNTREAARRNQCSCKLKQIGIALQNYPRRTQAVSGRFQPRQCRRRGQRLVARSGRGGRHRRDSLGWLHRGGGDDRGHGRL